MILFQILLVFGILLSSIRARAFDREAHPESHNVNVLSDSNIERLTRRSDPLKQTFVHKAKRQSSGSGGSGSGGNPDYQPDGFPASYDSGSSSSSNSYKGPPAGSSGYGSSSSGSSGGSSDSSSVVVVTAYTTSWSTTTATPSPTTTTLSASQSALAAMDIQFCGYVESSDLYMTFGVLIPNYQSTFDFDTVNNDFRGSLDGNSKCEGFTFYQSAYTGLEGTTFAASFNVPTICTAWEMTQVIMATTGDAQYTGCHTWDGAVVEGGPDVSNLIPDLPEPPDDPE